MHLHRIVFNANCAQFASTNQMVTLQQLLWRSACICVNRPLWRTDSPSLLASMLSTQTISSCSFTVASRLGALVSKPTCFQTSIWVRAEGILELNRRLFRSVLEVWCIGQENLEGILFTCKDSAPLNQAHDTKQQYLARLQHYHVVRYDQGFHMTIGAARWTPFSVVDGNPAPAWLPTGEK